VIGIARKKIVASISDPRSSLGARRKKLVRSVLPFVPRDSADRDEAGRMSTSLTGHFASHNCSWCRISAQM